MCRSRVDFGAWSVSACVVLAALAAALGTGCGTRRPVKAAHHPVQTATTATARPDAALVAYSGVTSQHRHLELLVDRKRSVETALRFSIDYSCVSHRTVGLHALILRPDQSWGIVNRSAPASTRVVLGFSDWFSGPTGHDFHITGTLSADSGTVTGTLHSLLLSSRDGRCDSGHLRYRATLTATRFAVPARATITRAQYRRVPSGITIGTAERLLGVPNDRDVFDPADLVSGTLPSGVPGAGQAWLDYAWRGHPRRYFQFFFGAGGLIPGEPGRSVASS